MCVWGFFTPFLLEVVGISNYSSTAVDSLSPAALSQRELKLQTGYLDSGCRQRHREFTAAEEQALRTCPFCPDMPSFAACITAAKWSSYATSSSFSLAEICPGTGMNLRLT